MKRFFSFFAALVMLLPFVAPRAALADCGVKEKVKDYSVVEMNGPTGVCTDEKETCQGNTIQYSCCICETLEKGNAVINGQNIGILNTIGERGYTYDSCKDACKFLGNPVLGTEYKVYSQVGAGRLPPGQAGPKTLADVQGVAKYCFTQSECASKEYGGSPSAYRPGGGCDAGKGRCVAPEPQLKLSYPIGNVTTVAGYRGFVGVVFNYATGIAAIAAAIMFVWGGMRYIFGSAFQSIARAKEIMIDAAIGLALTLGAMAILRTVNPETLNLNKLDVYLINREQLLGQNFCTSITSKEGKLSFADAGRAPQFTPVSQLKDADYHIAQEATQCGFEYYMKGFGESRCKGQVCDPGKACISCKGGLCENENGFGCVKATIGGTITHDGARPVKDIHLLGLCNNLHENYSMSGDNFSIMATNAAVKAIFGDNPMNFNYLQIDSSFPNNAVVDLGPARVTTVNSVLQSYAYVLTDKDVETAKEGCDGYAPNGYVLAVEYTNDTLVPLFDQPNYTIVGKADCGKAGVFSGYVQGNALLADKNFSMQLAAACMVGRFFPKGNIGFNDYLSKLDPYEWSESVLTKKDASIKCDIKLDGKNAPGGLSSLPNTVEGTVHAPNAPGLDKSLPIVGQQTSGLGFVTCYGR